MKLNYETHPAAEMFPLMDHDEYIALKDSIRANGLYQKVKITPDDLVLDGRNRMRACTELGIVPEFEIYDGNPYEYVWALNGARRDINPGQKAAIRLKIDRASKEWQERQRARREAANEKRSAAAAQQVAAQPREADGKVAKTQPGPSGDPEGPGEIPPPHPKPAAQDLADKTGVSVDMASRVHALENKDPDLAGKVARGEMKLAEAERQLRRERLAEKTRALPAGKYRVLYVDPPWKYNDKRSGMESGYVPAENHYPTMSVSELEVLDVRALAADDSVLFCWATFPLLPDALEVIRAWGFKYKTAFVWDKQRANFGHYHDASAELLVVATRGSGTPEIDERMKQVQSWAHPGEHSRKPDEARQMIDKLYPNGPRIELFRRGDAPAGWDVWGNEASASEEN